MPESTDEHKLAVIDVELWGLNPEFLKVESKTRQNTKMPYSCFKCINFYMVEYRVAGCNKDVSVQIY